MSEIAFHSEVGAPVRYEPLYVSIAPDETQVLAGFDSEVAAVNAEALAAAGSTAAQFVLGHMLLTGQGVARDEAAAYRWFSLAAQSGRADALNMVGRCHECGWGVPVDRREAARWYRMAVDKAHAWAMFNLAALLLAGEGAERDVPAALSLFVRAARRGNAKAMNMLGQLREEGHGCAVNRHAAEHWYRRAAELGCFRGQHNLARFLARSGMFDLAAGWLRASFASAPAEFSREVAAGLIDHPSPVLRAVAREGLARAASA